MNPQFKEIVNLYAPAVIFSDGDWWMDDDKWETKPLLAWLFNEAPNKDEVVINDRWGKVRKNTEVTLPQNMDQVLLTLQSCGKRIGV